ncbi:tumor necrosis factor receptor superfamily member 10A-like isoform X2 [Cavia porcellus]|uniref:tumor necrosis factor receptor superfamily member 10A-like isoform X2 n=1 Tax=Cavia porcellus TaxID=10141 RepID=UPI000661BCDB|nr:tumor necrosis factor receptor superfamily member 10A-like isoform X2 [Cavia porcellus]
MHLKTCRWKTLQYSGPESCNSDEYMNAGHCCKMCPSGQYVEKPCMRPHTQGVCVKCELGTYTAYANGLESCLLCSTCRADQEVVQKCSPTNDQKCECKQGYFCENAGFSEVCTPCDKCPDGTAVLQECNATSNTVCGAAHSELSNQQSEFTFLVPIIVISLVFMVALLVWHFRNKFASWICRMSNSIGGRGGTLVSGNANGCDDTRGQSAAESSVTEVGDECSSDPASTSHTSPGEEGSCMLPQNFESSIPGDPSPYVVTPDTMPEACGSACPGSGREDERTESQNLLGCISSNLEASHQAPPLRDSSISWSARPSVNSLTPSAVDANHKICSHG